MLREALDGALAGGGDGPAVKASSVLLGATIGLVLAGLAVATFASNTRRT